MFWIVIKVHIVMHVSATPASFHSVDTCEMKVTNIIWRQSQSFKCWNEEKSLSSFSLLYGWDTRKHDCACKNTTKVYDCRLEPAEWFMKASIKITLSRPAVGQSRGQILTTISQEMALTQKKTLQQSAWFPASLRPLLIAHRHLICTGTGTQSRTCIWEPAHMRS